MKKLLLCIALSTSLLAAAGSASAHCCRTFWYHDCCSCFVRSPGTAVSPATGFYYYPSYYGYYGYGYGYENACAMVRGHYRHGVWIPRHMVCWY